MFSSLMGLPIGSIEDRAKVGVVGDIIINPDDGLLLGIIAKTGILNIQPRFVSWADIREVESGAVVINSKDDLCEIDEVIRVKEVIDKNFSLTGLPVVTTDGNSLGDVYDYEIDVEKKTLFKIFCRALLGQRHIISKSNIVRIELNKVVVRSAAVKSKISMGTTAHAVKSPA